MGELAKIDEEVILVGHSLGGTVILKILSEEQLFSSKISGIISIAAPYWGIDPDWQLEDFTYDLRFPSQLPQVPIFFYHSEDDEIVPFSHFLYYQQQLPQARFRTLCGQGHHFDGGDFRELLTDIEELSGSV